MLKEIRKEIRVIREKEEIILPDNIKKQINEHWNKSIKENPNLFNGEIWTVTKLEEEEKEIIFTIKKTNYAHYLYGERVGLDKKYSCFNLNCGILLETKDRYYIIGEMDKTTSYPGGLQISGGNLDQNDIKTNGEVDIVNNVARELKEELNIDLFDKNIVESFKFKYLEYPEGRRCAYTFIMKGKLTLTSEEVKKRFSEYLKYLIKTRGEIEFSKLHFLKCEKADEELKKLNNPKREYLETLISMDMKDRGIK